MADTQDNQRRTAAEGHRVFGEEAPGTTPGGDPATTEREGDTTGLRADDAPSAEEFAQRALTHELPGHGGETHPAVADKALHERLPGLDDATLSRLAVLDPGTALEQGGVYLDLNDLARGPFKALAGHEATPRNRYVAKRGTDYELWNRLVGRDDEPTIERPGEGV